MKRMTIMLAGLLLMLGASPGQTFAEEYDRDSAAIIANDAGLSLQGLRRDQGLFYDFPRVSAEVPPAEDDSDKGILACHFTGGCGYTVNSQVRVDLQYRIVSPEQSGATVASNVAGDRLAPNLMLGFRYNF